MARYARTNKPDLLDVFAVYRQYSFRWREYTGFGSEKGPRKSDYDLWDDGKPALQLDSNVADGFTSLTFTFRDTSRRDAEEWVRDYVNAYSLPYTSFEVGPVQSLKKLIKNSKHDYVLVKIMYVEHESQK